MATIGGGPATTGAQPGVNDDKARLDAANKSVQSLTAKAKLLQYQKDHLKKPGKSDVKGQAKYKLLVAGYSRQILTAQTQLSAVKKAIPSLQNKYYVSSGQYDKLLTGANRDAFMALNSLFQSYGLGSLAGKIYGYVKNGESADTISIQLQDTSEYKARFAGNEARKAAGLPVLSPAQYLSTEESFDQIMKASGLPSGFYDSKGDFANWIGKNISPTEIQSRVDMATQATILSNPDYRKALNQMGIDNAHLTAYFLDTDKALPYLQKAAATAQIGAEALHQNLAFDQAYADKLATEGITAQQAASGYQQIAGELDTMKALGSMYGENWTQRTSEQAAFEGNAGATAERGRLMSRERAAFGGATGGARGGLGQEGGAR